MTTASGTPEQFPSDFILGVDLDGVCADFIGGLRPIAEEWLGVDAGSLDPQPSVNFPEWDLEAAGGFDSLYRYAVTRRDLLRTLPPIKGASLALRRLWTKKRVRIRIITHRLYFEFFHRIAVTQTIDWLDHHDFPYWDLCFMKDKAAVGADLYIEDSPGNVKALRAAGKKVIAFINSTNRDLAGPKSAEWAEVEDLVLAELSAWEEKRGGVPRPLPGA